MKKREKGSSKQFGPDGPPREEPLDTLAVSNLVQCIPDDLCLSVNERSVLSKGLKFIPVQNTTSKYKTLLDVERFFRKLRWMAVLGTVPRAPPFTAQDDIFTHLFQPAPGREPPHGKFADVELYITKCHKEIKKLSTKPLRHSNLTPDEWQALRSLKSRQDIGIKPADKGGAVVVWDRDLYVKEAQRQLSDSSFYLPLSVSSLPRDQNLISETVKQHIKQNHLPPTANLLVKPNAKQPTFYLLPKLHKANTPGRPIVSACSCPTEHISQYSGTRL